MRKGTKLYSIFRMKCPHCHEGDFFLANPYNLKKAGEMHDKCPVCHEKLSIEPGFYYGAMYVAYGLGVASFVAGVVATRVLYPEATAEIYIAVVGAIIVLLGPLLFALSKIIWANLFMKYKGREVQNES